MRIGVNYRVLNHPSYDFHGVQPPIVLCEHSTAIVMEPFNMADLLKWDFHQLYHYFCEV